MSTTKTPMPNIRHDIRPLRNDALDAIAGATIFTDMLDAVIKALGESLSNAARKG